MPRTTYMIVEHFRNGDAAPVYRRFREQGRMAPEGLSYVSSWVTPDMTRCYQIMEAPDRSLLDEWMANWQDLVEFEVHPVITSAQASQREAITTFLASIGIPVHARALDSSTLLPGVTVDRGTVVFDPSHLAWPGDLLHEAGHIAVTPAHQRAMLADTIPEGLLAPHAGEPEATAWAYAATVAIGLHPSVLFHEGGYHGNSAGLIATFMNGCYPGAAGLIAAGMTLSQPQAAAAGAPPYPAMQRWLRD